MKIVCIVVKIVVNNIYSVYIYINKRLDELKY